jgi:transcriptional regulator with XRE-family HTH domain
LEPVQFGPWLRAARDSKGISAEEIAASVGVSVQAVYGWEKPEGSRPGRSRWQVMETAYRLPPGAIAAALSEPMTGGSLDYWRGRVEQIAAHLRAVLTEQEELAKAMREASEEASSSRTEASQVPPRADQQNPVPLGELTTAVASVQERITRGGKRRPAANE